VTAANPAKKGAMLARCTRAAAVFAPDANLAADPSIRERSAAKFAVPSILREESDQICSILHALLRAEAETAAAAARATIIAPFIAGLRSRHQLSG